MLLNKTTASASKIASKAMGATRAMSGKEIKFGVDGRAAMLRGVNLLADAVQVSCLLIDRRLGLFVCLFICLLLCCHALLISIGQVENEVSVICSMRCVPLILMQFKSYSIYYILYYLASIPYFHISIFHIILPILISLSLQQSI